MTITYLAQDRAHLRMQGSNVDMSATNSSDSFPCGPFQNISIQMVWSTVTGAASTIKLQSSNDGTNWDDLDGSSFSTSGATGSKTIQIQHESFYVIRVTISSASTTGTLSVVVSENGR